MGIYLVFRSASRPARTVNTAFAWRTQASDVAPHSTNSTAALSSSVLECYEIFKADKWSNHFFFQSLNLAIGTCVLNEWMNPLKKKEHSQK